MQGHQIKQSVSARCSVMQNPLSPKASALQTRTQTQQSQYENTLRLSSLDRTTVPLVPKSVAVAQRRDMYIGFADSKSRAPTNMSRG